MPHQGSGVKIGNTYMIFTNVVLDAKHGGEEDGFPSIGDNVMIGAGAVILGNINIGNNVSIGANSVILTDVPDDSIVVGIPEKIIGKKESS